MADDRLRRLERAALSTPDDMESFLRWRAELQRVQPPNERHPAPCYGAVATIPTPGSSRAVHDIGFESVVIADASKAPLTARLPRASESAGRHCTVKKVDSTANTVTIIGRSNDEVVDGNQGYVLAQRFESASLVCDGRQWLVVGVLNEWTFEFDIAKLPGHRIDPDRLMLEIEASAISVQFLRIDTTGGHSAVFPDRVEVLGGTGRVTFAGPQTTRDLTILRGTDPAALGGLLAAHAAKFD